jgi:hypothetical protein
VEFLKALLLDGAAEDSQHLLNAVFLKGLLLLSRRMEDGRIEANSTISHCGRLFPVLLSWL